MEKSYVPWKIGNEVLYYYSHQKTKYKKLEHSNKAIFFWISGSIREKSTFTLLCMSMFKGLHRQNVNGFAFNVAVIQVKKIKWRQPNRLYGEVNTCSGSQEIPRLLWNQKVPTVFTWSTILTPFQTSPVHRLTPVSFKMYLFIILTCKPYFLTGPFQHVLSLTLST
jgi:hypothetical protein